MYTMCFISLMILKTSMSMYGLPLGLIQDLIISLLNSVFDIALQCIPYATKIVVLALMRSSAFLNLFLYQI